jgi:hypothetical protein
MTPSLLVENSGCCSDWECFSVEKDWISQIRMLFDGLLLRNLEFGSAFSIPSKRLTMAIFQWHLHVLIAVNAV